METSPDKEVHIELKRAFLAYAMAKTYELAGLQQLAMHKIEQHSSEMNIFDVFEAINEDFSKFQGDIDWVQHYLKEKMKVTFEEDYTAFARNDFFVRISNDALYKFLIQCVLELYHSKVSRLLKIEEESITGFAEEYVPATQDSPVEEASAEVTVASEEAPVEDCPVHEEPTQECSVQECSVGDPSVEEELVQECSIGDPPVEEELVQEAYIEETFAADQKVDTSFGDAGGSNSPGYRVGAGWPSGPWDFDMGPNDVKVKHAGKDNNFWGLLHNKTSGLNFKSDASDAPSIQRAPVTEANPPVDDGWGFSGSKAKDKKKKVVATTIDESIPEFVPESEKLEEKDHGTFWFGAKNKENEKNGAARLEDDFVTPEPASDPVLEPEPEATKEYNTWASFATGSKKKGKKSYKKNVIEESAAAIEDTSAKLGLTSEPVIRPAKKGKKKYKEDVIEESAAVVEDTSAKLGLTSAPVIRPAPEATKGDDVYGFDSALTGSSKTVKKKSKKNVVDESAAVIEDTSAQLEIDLEPMIHPEPEAAKEDDMCSWGFGRKKKGKKGAIKVVEEEPKIEELAAPAFEPARLADGGWVSFEVPGKKKKGKNSAKQEELITESSSAHSEPELLQRCSYCQSMN